MIPILILTLCISAELVHMQDVTLDKKDSMIQKLQGSVEHLLIKVRQQDNVISSLASTLERQDIEIQALIEKDRVNSAEIEQLKDLSSEVAQQTQGCSQMCNDVHARMNGSLSMDRIFHNPEKRQTSRSHPAFYAHLSSTHANLGIHHVVTFNKVQLNIGNAYNEATGIFTVPVSGLYAFSWTVISSGHGHIFTDLVLNGQIYGGVIADSDDTLDLSVGSTTAVLEAKAGDQVYIWTTDHQQPTANFISTDGARSSFAGWLIA